MADLNCLSNEDEIDSVLADESQITSDMENEDEISVNFENVVEITKTYRGLETNDAIVDVDNTANTIAVNLKKLWFNNSSEFPSVGSPNIIYIDESTGNIYKWNEEEIHYEILILHWSEIEEIDGGNANGE